MATWRVMICVINGMTLGFPAGFSIVFGLSLKLLLFNFLSTFQRAETDKFSSDTLSIFLETSFLLQTTLRCAFAVPPLKVRFSFLFLSSFFLYCSIISDFLFPFISLLLLVLVFLLGF